MLKLQEIYKEGKAKARKKNPSLVISMFSFNEFFDL